MALPILEILDLFKKFSKNVERADFLKRGKNPPLIPLVFSLGCLRGSHQ